VEDKFLDEHLFVVSSTTPWFVDIANFLATSLFPYHFTSKQKKQLVKESLSYKWLNGLLFKYGPDFILCRCMRVDKIFDVLRACHDEPSGGHYSSQRTIHKILGASYY